MPINRTENDQIIQIGSYTINIITEKIGKVTFVLLPV